MKRSVCSKLLSVAVVAAALATACTKHEEVEFSGTLVGIRNCEVAFTDRNAGYMVQLEVPEGVGGTVTDQRTGERMTNIIVLYEPDRIIQVSSHIHGKFYYDNQYSKANSCVQWNDEEIGNLPEGVFVQVVVD